MISTAASDAGLATSSSAVPAKPPGIEAFQIMSGM
jgi:hypothetical protein